MPRSTITFLILVTVVSALVAMFLPDHQSGSTTPTSTTREASTAQYGKRQDDTHLAPGTSTSRSTTDDSGTDSGKVKIDDLPEGVNPRFHDKPEVQSAWMDRGKNIVIENYPDADSAEFRNTFFHRGAKARPVTCGEVQFLTKGNAINEYQRFIYTGVHSTYLEQDVTNFDIFWSMMCEQTSDEYFEYQDAR
jgi:hypothetical protein